MQGTALEKWSSNLKSVQKDVECIFRVLDKKQFLLLKHPMRFHDLLQIERVVVTYCVLHNLLLEYNGLDDVSSC